MLNHNLLKMKGKIMQVKNVGKQVNFRASMTCTGEYSDINMVSLELQKSNKELRKILTHTNEAPINMWPKACTEYPFRMVFTIGKKDSSKLSDFCSTARHFGHDPEESVSKFNLFYDQHIKKYLPNIETYDAKDVLKALKEKRFDFKNYRIK